MFLHILQELCPFDADKRINFHSKFNENSISFSPYSVNVVTNCEFSICYKIIFSFFSSRFKYLQIVFKFVFLSIAPARPGTIFQCKGNNSYKHRPGTISLPKGNSSYKKNGIQMYNFRIKSGIYTRSMHIPCPIAHFHNSKDTDILTHIKCT